MKPCFNLTMLALALVLALPSVAQTPVGSGADLKLLAASSEDSPIPARNKVNALTPQQAAGNARPEFNYYLNRAPTRPLMVDPHKWALQPQVNSWESMEQATNSAMQNLDGYSLYQLAYIEFVHNYTISKLNPKTMLYKAFEIGKANGDPYLMYWVTEFEGTAYFHYEYLQRRRNHAEWTDSVATEKKEVPVLKMLADLNDKCFLEMKELAKQYLQCAYLKDETYGLIPFDIRQKTQEMEKNSSKK